MNLWKTVTEVGWQIVRSTNRKRRRTKLRTEKQEVTFSYRLLFLSSQLDRCASLIIIKECIITLLLITNSVNYAQTCLLKCTVYVKVWRTAVLISQVPLQSPRRVADGNRLNETIQPLLRNAHRGQLIVLLTEGIQEQNRNAECTCFIRIYSHILCYRYLMM